MPKFQIECSHKPNSTVFDLFVLTSWFLCTLIDHKLADLLSPRLKNVTPLMINYLLRVKQQHTAKLLLDFSCGTKYRTRYWTVLKLENLNGAIKLIGHYLHRKSYSHSVTFKRMNFDFCCVKSQKMKISVTVWPTKLRNVYSVTQAVSS